MAERAGGWASALVELLLPAACGGCGAGGTSWCPRCARSVGPPRPVRVPGVPPVYAAARYRGPVRTALLAYKERGRRDLAVPLAALLAVPLAAVHRPPGPPPVPSAGGAPAQFAGPPALPPGGPPGLAAVHRPPGPPPVPSAGGTPAQPAGPPARPPGGPPPGPGAACRPAGAPRRAAVPGGVGPVPAAVPGRAAPAPAPGPLWLVPAPSRAGAARSRGGDHVLRLCRLLAAADPGLRVAAALRPARRARDSVGLDAGQRRANLAAGLRVRPGRLPPPGAGVVLVDDVVTSGATLAACTAALGRAGAYVVGAVVLCDATTPWTGAIALGNRSAAP